MSSAMPPQKFRFSIPTASMIDVTIGNLWLSEQLLGLEQVTDFQFIKMVSCQETVNITSDVLYHPLYC